MASLQEFQAAASEITAATQTIAAYIQGSGMTAAEQDQALQVVAEAVATLKTVIPAPPTE